MRRLPLVGYAVGKLADCLPGFRPRRATAPPGRPSGVGGSNTTGNFSAGDDSSEGARWIMGEASAQSALESSYPRTVSIESPYIGGGASEVDAPDWSRLHVDSCLGRAVRAPDGRWVFTGEGYDPSMNLVPAAPPVEGEDATPHRRAEDLTSFPPQFPLESGGGPFSTLRKRVAPRFDDPHFEQRYRQHRGKGLDSVQLWFALMATLYVVALWIYHAVDPNVADSPSMNLAPAAPPMEVGDATPHRRFDSQVHAALCPTPLRAMLTVAVLAMAMLTMAVLTTGANRAHLATRRAGRGLGLVGCAVVLAVRQSARQRGAGGAGLRLGGALLLGAAGDGA